MITISKPLVSASENGPGAADVETRTYDPYERLTQVTDADGFVHTWQYDAATSAVTQSVVDPGAQPHLNLTTMLAVDTLGRTTQLTDPKGNIACTVYNDPNHEVRVYPGWNTNTSMPTGT